VFRPGFREPPADPMKGSLENLLRSM
jgi:hypothetical protein